jgi:gluconate 5-dehydrogenase
MSGALDLFRLDGRVAVVTGGSKGIGMFYSPALTEAGASVVVADIDAASVAQTSERWSKESSSLDRRRHSALTLALFSQLLVHRR